MSKVNISPLVIEGREILPAFSLDREITRYGSSAQEVYKTAPTLAQLRHAFETSAEIRADVLANRYRGEWTATFLRDGKEAIERPDNVFYDQKSGLWIAEGGKVTRVELPGEGWALEYDKPTGFPSRTSSKRKDAERVFGNDASYFWVDKNGLRAVRRSFDRFGGDGPFDVVADWRPDDGRDDLGSRSVVQGSLSQEDIAKEADYGKLPFEEFAAKYMRQ
jgi:hypothetical protein